MFAYLQKSTNIQTNQGRKAIFKLFLNKKDGVFGDIYKDMKNFEFSYGEANQTFAEYVQPKIYKG